MARGWQPQPLPRSRSLHTPHRPQTPGAPLIPGTRDPRPALGADPRENSVSGAPSTGKGAGWVEDGDPESRRLSHALEIVKDKEKEKGKKKGAI